jgi:hypothetical protein
MDMIAPDVTVQVGVRRYSCVLDPGLAFSPYGVAVACGLSRVMEVWMVPEFFHILDNTYFYLDRPELLLPPISCGHNEAEEIRDQTTRALRHWEKLRVETDLVRRSLNWVGDALRDSSLPEGVDLALPSRWQALAEALDDRVCGKVPPNTALYSTTRDAAALSAALPAAGILTHITSSAPDDEASPTICDVLGRFGLPCKRLAALDHFAILERDIYRLLVIRAGLAKYLWSGLHLALLHLVVPEIVEVTGSSASDRKPVDEMVIEHDAPVAAVDPWKNAHGWWYLI